MAIYRNIQMSFWTDSKITDDFTPEERYFYLYLMTNPHTNLAGCYEISMKHISDETGYNRDKVEKLITKLTDLHKVILYSKDTKEILLLKWHKYNWTRSEKFRKSLIREIESVKNVDFKGYLKDLYDGIDTVSIPYTYGIDTTVSVTVTDTVSGNDNNINNNNINKHKYGEYKNVLLSDKDIQELNNKHGEEDTQAAIGYLDMWIEEKGYKSKNHKLALERWVFKAVEEKKVKKPTGGNVTPFSPTDYLLQQIREEESANG